MPSGAQVVQAGSGEFSVAAPGQHGGRGVNGINQHCHVLCNLLYTAYYTLPSKDRMTMLRVLQGGADPLFRCNDLAIELMGKLGVTAKWIRFAAHPVAARSRRHGKKNSTRFLMCTCPNLGSTCAKRVKEALAIGRLPNPDHLPSRRSLTV